MHLYEIAQKYREVLEGLISDEEGNYDPTELDTLSEEFAEKAEQIALFVKELKYEAAAIKEEEDNLYKRRKAKESKAEFLSGYLTDFFAYLDQTKLETAKVKVSFRKSESVEIYSADDIPEEYRTTKIMVTPDKTSIKTAIKDGIDVPGAEIVIKQNIQIK